MNPGPGDRPTAGDGPRPAGDFPALLATWLVGRHPAGGALLHRAAERLAAAQAEGHSCLPLAALAGPDPQDDGDLAAALLASGAVGRPGGAMRELTLDRDRLYLTRHHRAEVRLAAALVRRLDTPPLPIGPRARSLVRQLFAANDERPDRQAVACIAALRRRFQVIVGGPGTGKTTTVARLLALVVADDPQARIAIAAPTGKAAQRLGESIAGALASLAGVLDPASVAHLRAAAAGSTTLHRLLAWHGSDGRFRRTADDPLAYDLVVVDEASMVDLPLFAALADALPDPCRLVVLGDAGQLASVDTGTVLADLHRAAELDGPDHSPDLAAAVDGLLGQELAADPRATARRDAVVELRRSHRFGSGTPIGRLAAAVRAGDRDGAIAALTAAGRPAATLDQPAATWGGGIGGAIDGVLPTYAAVLAAASPAEALARLGRARLLTAQRDGPRGVDALNTAVERRLAAGGGGADRGLHRGRPLLITANDPDTGLANGDVGILWPLDGDPASPLSAWFPDRAGGLRRFAPARLPAHQTAWAMTIHKSQGSEFDLAVVILPAAIGPLACRQLLYTGLTRARLAVHLVADAAVLRHAVATTAWRHSGLVERIARAR